MDGRPNSKNKAAFSNFSGLAWVALKKHQLSTWAAPCMDPLVSIELAFLVIIPFFSFIYPFIYLFITLGSILF